MTCAPRSAVTCRTVDLVVGKSHSESDDIEDFRPIPGGSTVARAAQLGYRHRQVHQPAGHGAHLVERRHALAREAVVVPLAGRPSSASSACRAKPSAPRATPISASCRKSRASQALKQALESEPHRAASATEAGYDVGTRTAIDVLAARQHAGQALYELLAQPLRLHAQRAAPEAGRGPPRPQGARRRELAGWRRRRRRHRSGHRRRRADAA